MKNIKFWVLLHIAIIFTIFLYSCSSYTKVTYRLVKDEKYVREDGYILGCEKDNQGKGTVLYISTYTPDSWGENFYYGYLKGKKSAKRLKVKVINAIFIATNDTLTPFNIKDGKIYSYKSNNLEKIIDSNEKLKVIISLKDLITDNEEIKEYILIRDKNTYQTGILPHSF